jgi:hypothetical protein
MLDRPRTATMTISSRPRNNACLSTMELAHPFGLQSYGSGLVIFFWFFNLARLSFGGSCRNSLRTSGVCSEFSLQTGNETNMSWLIRLLLWRRLRFERALVVGPICLRHHSTIVTLDEFRSVLCCELWPLVGWLVRFV